MREHGVLKCVLLVYGEAIRRIDSNQDLPPESILDSAKIIRNFIEDYHEKLEEDYLFPALPQKPTCWSIWSMCCNSNTRPAGA